MIIAPHVYPPSIVGFDDSPLIHVGAGFNARLSASFGYLTKKACGSTERPALCPPVLVLGPVWAAQTDSGLRSPSLCDCTSMPSTCNRRISRVRHPSCKFRAY